MVYNFLFELWKTLLTKCVFNLFASPQTFSIVGSSGTQETGTEKKPVKNALLMASKEYGRIFRGVFSSLECPEMTAQIHFILSNQPIRLTHVLGTKCNKSWPMRSALLLFFARSVFCALCSSIHIAFWVNTSQRTLRHAVQWTQHWMRLSGIKLIRFSISVWTSLVFFMIFCENKNAASVDSFLAYISTHLVNFSINIGVAYHANVVFTPHKRKRIDPDAVALAINEGSWCFFSRHDLYHSILIIFQFEIRKWTFFGTRWKLRIPQINSQLIYSDFANSHVIIQFQHVPHKHNKC